MGENKDGKTVVKKPIATAVETLLPRFGGQSRKLPRKTQGQARQNESLRRRSVRLATSERYAPHAGRLSARMASSPSPRRRTMGTGTLGTILTRCFQRREDRLGRCLYRAEFHGMRGLVDRNRNGLVERLLARPPESLDAGRSRPKASEAPQAGELGTPGAWCLSRLHDTGALCGSPPAANGAGARGPGRAGNIAIRRARAARLRPWKTGPALDRLCSSQARHRIHWR